MASRRTVGVIIPAHDAGSMISQTLASVAAQSRRPDQVVVVDDRSSDDTAEVAQSWADRLPLQVLRLEQNVGAGRARAAGIALLETDRVALLDADDYWFPDHLDHLTALHDVRGGMVCPLSFDWWPGTRIRPHAWRVPKDDQLAKLTERCWVFSGGVLSRDDYDRAGGFRHRPLVEDWDLWLRMAAQGTRFSEGAVPTVLYRRHTGNVTEQPMKVLEAAHRLISEHAAAGIVPQDAARRSLRSTEAEMALQRSAELYDAGQSWRARRTLVGGLKGRTKLKVGTAVALVAPTPVSSRLARRGYPAVMATQEGPAQGTNGG